MNASAPAHYEIISDLEMQIERIKADCRFRRLTAEETNRLVEKYIDSVQAHLVVNS